jgi:TPR repeat protein
MTRKPKTDWREALRQGAAAGDPQATWECALLALGIDHPGRPFPGNALPFLQQLASRTASDLNQRAYDLINAAAQDGQTQAMVVRATWLLDSDRPQAMSLLTDAAERGDTAAMLCVGTELAAQDQPTALTWLTRLADGGDAAGMYALSGLLRQGDAGAGQDWLIKAAQAGSVQAQSDLAVTAFEHGEPLNRDQPPFVDPRLTGVLTLTTPVTRRARQVASCLKCGKKTVQDVTEFIGGRWYGRRGPTTAGKSGTRFHFSACAVCGCLYPVDAASRQYMHGRGRDFLNPMQAEDSRLPAASTKA